MFKKNDILIIAGVIVLAAVAAIVVWIAGSAKPGKVEIRVNGELTATYSLSVEREFTVKGYDGGEVHGRITNGTVDVTSATCPDKICVDHSVIKKTGESIVCLPNRVVITIAAGNYEGTNNTVDAVSGR